MKFFWLLLLLFKLSFSQFSFKKVDGLRWPISLDHIIVKTNRHILDSEFKGILKPLKGKLLKKLNQHNYYLIKFRNYSATMHIFQKQINHLRKISLIADVIPLLKYSEKLLSTDIYLNSNVDGFSTFKNDSLFNEINQLQHNFRTCYDKRLRLNSSLVRHLLIDFTIKNGKTSDLRILDTDIEENYMGCIKRVLQSEFWENKKATGKVRFLFIIKNDR